MADWIYVDNSNVFIEGKRVAAVAGGMALDIWDAMQHGILDNEYRMSFGKLYQFVAGDNPQECARAMLFGSRPPANDAIWQIAANAGFEVHVEDRNYSNKEKKIDTGIVTEIMKDAYTKAGAGDVFTIVSGDADYVPTVKMLISDDFQVDVVFWKHASPELREVCSNFIELDPNLDALRP
jgi:uncharacterized LabA/DUF88 family protein